MTRPSVEEWFDFLCPYCYLAQDRNDVLRSGGVDVVELPFAIHPEIGPGGAPAPPRGGPRYAGLLAEAAELGLPLTWSDRIPWSRPALVRAEVVRRHAPEHHAALCRATFAAHFADGRDIGQREVLDAVARAIGLDAELFSDPAVQEAGERDVEAAAHRARELGVTGTPAWSVSGALLVGLRPRRDFERVARRLTGG